MYRGGEGGTVGLLGDRFPAQSRIRCRCNAALFRAPSSHLGVRRVSVEIAKKERKTRVAISALRPSGNRGGHCKYLDKRTTVAHTELLAS